MRFPKITDQQPFLPFLISSLLITLFLFFIDEGQYNFEWTLSWGNWVAFFIYVIPVFVMQLLFSSLLKTSQQNLKHTALSIFFGSIIGLTLVMGFFLSMGHG